MAERTNSRGRDKDSILNELETSIENEIEQAGDGITDTLDAVLAKPDDVPDELDNIGNAEADNEADNEATNPFDNDDSEAAEKSSNT